MNVPHGGQLGNPTHGATGAHAGVGRPSIGWQDGQVLRVRSESPPAISTMPFGNRVAVAWARATFSVAASVDVTRVIGS